MGGRGGGGKNHTGSSKRFKTTHTCTCMATTADVELSPTPVTGGYCFPCSLHPIYNRSPYIMVAINK